MDEEERSIAIREEVVPSLLVGTPADRVSQATAVANALAPVIKDKKLFATISNRRHVLFEGWTTLGALMGVFPVTVSVTPTDDGFEAHVEARTLAGAVVGSAIALCSRSEKSWANRDDFALMSMAQTRAGSKALRMPLGFIMQLAGYEATPAEELGAIDGEYREVNHQPAKPAQRKPVTVDEAPARSAFWARAKEFGIDKPSAHHFFGVGPEDGALGEYVKQQAEALATSQADVWKMMRGQLETAVQGDVVKDGAPKVEPDDIPFQTAEDFPPNPPMITDAQKDYLIGGGNVPREEALTRKWVKHRGGMKPIMDDFANLDPAIAYGVIFDQKADILKWRVNVLTEEQADAMIGAIKKELGIGTRKKKEPVA